MDSFRDALQVCELADLGFEGDPFTWRNQCKEMWILMFVKDWIGKRLIVSGVLCSRSSE
jgi:hypothetical protein